MRSEFNRTGERKKMAKSTLKLNKMSEKKKRTFQIIFQCSTDCKEEFIEADEISNIDGVVEIFADEKLIAVVNDYVWIKEVCG